MQRRVFIPRPRSGAIPSSGIAPGCIIGGQNLNSILGLTSIIIRLQQRGANRKYRAHG